MTSFQGPYSHRTDTLAPARKLSVGRLSASKVRPLFAIHVDRTWWPLTVVPFIFRNLTQIEDWWGIPRTAHALIHNFKTSAFVFYHFRFEKQNIVMSQKKVRKANFTPKEIGILLEEIRMEKLVLCSHFTNEITNARKNEIWASIATKLSSCGADLRTATEAREKWGKLKTEAIQRRDLRRKTGNKPVKIVEHDDIVFDIIGEASPIVDGINVQGTETFLYNTEYPKSSSSTSPSGSPDCSQLQPLKQQSAVNISRVTHLGVEGTTTTIIKLDPNDATITEDATRIYNVMVPSHSASHILAGTPSLDTGIPSNSALNGQVIVVDEVAEINRDAEDGQPILSSTPSCDSSESTPKANTDRRKAARVKNRGRGRLQSKKTSVVGSLLLDNPQQIEEGSVLEQFLKSEIRKNGSIVQTNRSITQTNRVRKKFLENKNHLIEDQRRRMCLETEKLKLEVEFLKRKLNNNEG